MSDPDRDHRRVIMPPAGVRAQTAQPVEIEEETSEAYDIPEERARFRSGRTTDKRLDKLEKKTDTIGEKLAEHGGKLDTIVGFMSRADDRAAAEENGAIARARLLGEAIEKARDRRLKIWMAMIKILVPLVTALGIAFAAYKVAK